MRPKRAWMVNRSASVCVGCMWPPSPPLMTGTSAAWAATSAAPSLGWRMAMMSAKVETTRTVSEIVSPLDTEEFCALEKPMTCPPRRSMAVSKLRRVRVDGS